MCCITSKCVSLCFTALCFISSITVLCLYIYFAADKKFDFLGEVSVFLLVLSFIAFMIHHNIKMEPTNSNKSEKPSNIIPTNIEEGYL